MECTFLHKGCGINTVIQSDKNRELIYHSVGNECPPTSCGSISCIGWNDHPWVSHAKWRLAFNNKFWMSALKQWNVNLNIVTVHLAYIGQIVSLKGYPQLM